MLSTLKRHLPAIGAAIRTIIIFTVVLSIPLSAVQSLDLSPAQTSGWILALYGLPALLSLLLTLRYRQPIMLTGNIFVIIFVTRLAEQIQYSEIIGASIVTGVGVLLLSATGLTKRIAAWIPMPIIFGLLAGAVLPFVADVFTTMGDAPTLIWTTLLAYLISRRLLGNKLPAILPALIAGVVMAALQGLFGSATEALSLTAPEITRPEFTLSAIINVTPVFVILIVLQANIPSLRYMQSEGYKPPERLLETISGIGTALGSLFGPTGVSLSLPVTSLMAGPEAGEHEIRHRSVYLAGGVALLVGLLAGAATALTQIIPLSLLLVLAGLALVDVLSNALKQITTGPLLLGPIFAFAVALSDISLLGFGPFFWSLIIGTGISLLTEPAKLQSLRDEKQHN